MITKAWIHVKRHWCTFSLPLISMTIYVINLQVSSTLVHSRWPQAWLAAWPRRALCRSWKMLLLTLFSKHVST